MDRHVRLFQKTTQPAYPLGPRRAALTRQVEREQTRLDQLREQTWGVWLHEAEDGARSVVLPKGTPLGKNWAWKVQGQPALLLSRE